MMADTIEKKKIYSLDTSAILMLGVFYPPIRFPLVWEKLDQAARSGRIYLLDKVYDELQEKDDIVAGWVKERRDVLKKKFPNKLMVKVSDVIKTFPRLIDVNNTREQADPYIIVDAQVNGAVVVTHENRMNGLHPDRKKDKIPNVCEHYGVEYINNLSGYPNGFAMRLFDELGFDTFN